MLFMWWGLSITATCITWWHGIGAYFIYAAFLTILLSMPLILVNYKNFYLFSALLLSEGVLFNFFAIVLLFFPQWNGWGNWNMNGSWNYVYFTSSAKFNYVILALLLILFLLFGVKKFLEIDYVKMEQEALKDRKINKGTSRIFLDNAMSIISTLFFNVKLFARTEYYLYTAGFIFLCIFALPMQNLGSSLSRFGNNFYIALFFLLATYFLMWLSYWMAMTLFSQYRLINKIEKELGVKLKPALKDD